MRAGSGGSILRQIIVPHAAPGITAGCIVVFMLTLGNYLTPTLCEVGDACQQPSQGECVPLRGLGL